MSSKKGAKAAKAAKRSSKLVDAAQVGDVETMARVMSSGPKLDLDALVARDGWIGSGAKKQMPDLRVTALDAGTGVVDAAGGAGDVSFELVTFHGVKSTVVDPRAPPARATAVARRCCRRRRYLSQRRPRPRHRRVGRARSSARCGVCCPRATRAP